MTNRSKRPYMPPTHKNNARPLPQPAAPCKITTAQKRMTNRSNRPHMPPTHKNNARPLPQPAIPCKITTAPKRKSVIPNHAKLVSAFHILFQSLTPFLICSGFPRCPALVYFSCRFLFSPVPYRFFVFLSRSFFTHSVLPPVRPPTASFPFFPSKLSPQSLSLFHFRLPCYRFPVPSPPRRRFFPHPVFPVCRFPPRIFPIFFARFLV